MVNLVTYWAIKANFLSILYVFHYWDWRDNKMLTSVTVLSFKNDMHTMDWLKQSVPSHQNTKQKQITASVNQL